jgi:hypothetical protein
MEWGADFYVGEAWTDPRKAKRGRLVDDKTALIFLGVFRLCRPGSDVGAVLTRLLELCPVGPIPPHVLLAKVSPYQSEVCHQPYISSSSFI